MGADRSRRRAKAPLHLEALPETRRIAGVIPLVPAWRVDRIFDYLVPDSLGDVEVGSLVRVPFGNRRVRGVVVQFSERTPDRELAEIAASIFDRPIYVEPLAELVNWLAMRYVAPRGRAFARVVPPRVRVKAARVEPLLGGPAAERVLAYDHGPELVKAIESGAGGSWCLRVLPGEDRGALIAELVAAAGRGGGAALVAVPEVRYGSGVLEELERIWPELARVDFTRTQNDRARAMLGLAAGHGLGGGGRSAVLAPAPGLRMLAVDEEHHPSYKEDRSPAYDARRVAAERARLQRAVCVFLSPTPSVELGHAVAQKEIQGVDPARAAVRERRPIVELIEPEANQPMSHAMHTRMRAALRDGLRVALLASRRGWSRALWCAGCRRSLRCPVCEAGLFFDRGPRRVRCARCGVASPAPVRCPSCGASDWRYVGSGSERLAEQLASMFPRARVARVDPEILAGAGPGSIEPPDADVYVTTWIGTKDVLRPDVSMVGVLDADALIRRPDFRSSERAYQALAEMAEWAGPASSGGRLLIQTAEPAHHAVQAVARADYTFFLRRELTHRDELGYPPFSELVKVTGGGGRGEPLVAEAAELCRASGARVLGPISVRLGGGPARQILVKARDSEEIAAALRPLAAKVPSGDRLQIDVDPR